MTSGRRSVASPDFTAGNSGRSPLRPFALQEFEERARTQEEAAVRRRGERVGGSTEHLRPAAQRRTQIGFAGVAVTHFQKAGGEIGARQGIVGAQRERMPEGIGGSGIFAVQKQDATELDED